MPRDFFKRIPIGPWRSDNWIKCPVCFSGGEADLPYKNPEEKEDLELDLDVVEEETSGEEYEEYWS